MRAGRAVLDRAADLVADARFDMGADDAAADAFDAVRRLGGLVHAAQIDDGAHTDRAEGRAVLIGETAEMSGAEDGAAADEAAVGSAIAAEVAEVGAALQRQHMGQGLIEHASSLSRPDTADHVWTKSEFLRPHQNF